MDLYFKLNDLRIESNQSEDLITNMRFELMTVSFKAKREMLRFEKHETHMFYTWNYMNRGQYLDSAQSKFSEKNTTPKEFF